MRGCRGAAALLATMLLAGAPVAARSPQVPDRDAARWITTWGSAQMASSADAVLPDAQAADVTVRQVVRLSAGGTRVRVRFSNAFGTQPLVIGAAAVARPGVGARLVPGSGRALVFAGRPSVTVAAGAQIYSDPVALAVEPGAALAISLYLPAAPVGQTGHPGSRTTSFLIRGNHVADERPATVQPIVRWLSIADVEVEAGPDGATVVAIGDSITDGYGMPPDSDRRWTDTLAARLRARPATRAIGVVSAGIGGNRVLLDGTGPNLLARFDRDVIARSGVKWVILLEGVNDLGALTRYAPATPAAHAAIVSGIIQAYTEVVARAHAHGIRVIGGTIMPFAGFDLYHPGPETEADRQAVNRFIRTSGLFDAVVDFDAVMRDPARPDRLAARYDAGDHIHPSVAGYEAMGEAVPLALFAPSRSRRR